MDQLRLELAKQDAERDGRKSFCILTQCVTDTFAEQWQWHWNKTNRYIYSVQKCFFLHKTELVKGNYEAAREYYMKAGEILHGFIPCKKIPFSPVVFVLSLMSSSSALQQGSQARKQLTDLFVMVLERCEATELILKTAKEERERKLKEEEELQRREQERRKLEEERRTKEEEDRTKLLESFNRSSAILVIFFDTLQTAFQQMSSREF